jgi:hypothetical protein
LVYTPRILIYFKKVCNRQVMELKTNLRNVILGTIVLLFSLIPHFIVVNLTNKQVCSLKLDSDTRTQLTFSKIEACISLVFNRTAFLCDLLWRIYFSPYHWTMIFLFLWVSPVYWSSSNLHYMSQLHLITNVGKYLICPQKMFICSCRY